MNPPEVEGQARPTQRHDHCTRHLRHPPSTDTHRRCGNLTIESIIAIANHCPKLAQLNVGECSNLTDESIIAIANHCPELAQLNVE